MEGKAYLALYACGLTRGVYLDLLPSLETSKFLASLKGFIARRGRPCVIYSDNGSTFKAAADWLRKAMKDEKFHTCLSKLDIAWRFDLSRSRAPWWGGQFERLIGVFKSAFRKAVGNRTLSWGELSDVVLDVEIAMNGRPLSYLEEDVELPVLTPSSMLHLQPSQLPELNAYHIEEPDLRKRAKYLYRCKEAMWSRWTREYVRSLRERHSRSGGKQTSHPSVGEVVIIQDESRNRNSWKLGIVERLIVGRDGIVRGAKLRAGKGVLERAVQQVYPLELSCDRTDARLNPEAELYRTLRTLWAFLTYSPHQVQVIRLKTCIFQWTEPLWRHSFSHLHNYSQPELTLQKNWTCSHENWKKKIQSKWIIAFYSRFTGITGTILGN